MDAKEILANAKDIKYTISTTLDNTLVNEYDYNDWHAGEFTPFGGSSCLDIDYKSNAIVYISNSQALHQPSDEIAINGLSLTQSISGSFDSSVETSFGTARLINTRTSDEYSLRSWKGKPYDIKIGGTLYCGTDQEQTLEYDEYVTWFNGRIDDFSVNNTSIDLSLSTLDSKFLAPFPPNNDNNGSVNPYIIGSVNGFAPKSEGGGLFRFHEGSVETNDQLTDKLSSLGGSDGSPTELFDLFPSISIGEGRDYYHDLKIGSLDDIPESDASAALVQQSGFIYSQVSDNLVDETNNTHEVQVDDTLGLSFRDKTIVITNPNPVRSSYGYGDFSWIETSTGFVANRGLPISVETTGDIISGGVGGGWFKFRADGSGTVTINFPETVTSMKMIIRSVNSAFQTVSNFSVSPDSISPELPTTIVENHKLTFNDFNETSLSFDYSSTTEAKFVAVWFEDINIINKAVGAVRFNFDNDVNDIDLSITTQNNSQGVISNSIVPNSTDGFSRAHSVIVEIGSGEIEMDLNSFRQNTDAFGAFYSSDDGSISIKPRPARVFPSTFTEGLVDGIQAALPSIGSTIGESTDWALKIRARISSDSPIDVKAVAATERLFVKVVTLTQDWQEFEFTLKGGDLAVNGASVSGDEIRPNLFFGVWQDAIFEIFGIEVDVTNPVTEYEVEVDYIRAYPIGGNSEQIKTYVIESGSRQEIPTYRVNDATRYQGKLPDGVALYDDRGYICVSPNYQTIIGDFNGSSIDTSLLDACREISVLSTGVDSIDTELTVSPLVGHAMNQQKPAIEHIQDIIGTSDYFYQQNLTDENITIRKRSDSTQYPSDFAFDETDIKQGSVSRTGSENLEQQYIVEYQRDYSDSDLSKTVKSQFAGNSKLDTRKIVTSLRNKEDAQLVADLISRDSAENGLYRSSIVGVGRGVQVDDAGVQTHPDIPKSKPSIVRSVTQNTSTRETQLLSKVLT